MNLGGRRPHLLPSIIIVQPRYFALPELGLYAFASLNEWLITWTMGFVAGGYALTAGGVCTYSVQWHTFLRSSQQESNVRYASKCNHPARGGIINITRRIRTLDLEALDAGTCHSPPRVVVVVTPIAMGCVVTREAFPRALESDAVGQRRRMGFCVSKGFAQSKHKRDFSSRGSRSYFNWMVIIIYHKDPRSVDFGSFPFRPVPHYAVVCHSFRHCCCLLFPEKSIK